ncbi:DUF4199 domain-containing protein [Chitinophaga sp. 212800010-3]|uniref:DUF4199 domain-containing protein n=1 Tax=unclassified Chitinophaga TaxID=2619133 RepID=UPI002DF61148|nr:DUF4199 domain-containing protein [Chitinophaga sp. 212800010-3]
MKNYNIEFKWALVFAGTILLWNTIEEIAGFHNKYIASQPIFGAIILIPAVIIYVFALKEKRTKWYGGIMNYKQGVLSGVILSLMIGALSILTSNINLRFIAPQYLSNAADYAVSKGTMTAEAAKQQFNLSGYIVTGAIGAVITGAIITAVVMLFLRRNKHTTAASSINA